MAEKELRHNAGVFRRQRTPEAALFADLEDASHQAPPDFKVAHADLALFAGGFLTLLGFSGMLGVLPLIGVMLERGTADMLARSLLLETAPGGLLLLGLLLAIYFAPRWQGRVQVDGEGMVFRPGPGQRALRIRFDQLCQADWRDARRGRKIGLRLRYYPLSADGRPDYARLWQADLPTVKHHAALVRHLQRKMAAPPPASAMLAAIEHRETVRPLWLVATVAVITVALLLLDAVR